MNFKLGLTRSFSRGDVGQIGLRVRGAPGRSRPVSSHRKAGSRIEVVKEKACPRVPLRYNDKSLHWAKEGVEAVDGVVGAVLEQSAVAGQGEGDAVVAGPLRDLSDVAGDCPRFG